MHRIDSREARRPPVESIRSARCAPLPPDLERERRALFSLFLLNGLLLSSWFARVPAVRDALGLTPVELGTIAAVGAAGGILTASMASRVLAWLGGRSTLWISTGVFALSLVLLGLGPALGLVQLVVLGILSQAVAFALGNLPLNVASTDIERRAGRTVLPYFHGGYSVGAVLGALTGAACAATHVTLLVQFLVTAVIAVAWRIAAVPIVIRDTAGSRDRSRAGENVSNDVARGAETRDGRGTHAAAGAGGSAWKESRTVLLGVMALSGSVCEGAANDWLSLSVVDGFRRPAAMGAIVFGTFVASMTTMRFAGPRIIDRFGRVRTLRTCALAACAGLAVYATAPMLPVALVGVVAWGAGIALIVPIAIASASDDPARAARRVAVVSTLSSAVGLVGSPVLGVAVQTFGARHALGLVAIIALGVALLGRRTAPLSGSAAVAGSFAVAGRLEVSAGPRVALGRESRVRWLIRHRGSRRLRPGRSRRIGVRRRYEEVTR